MFRRNFITRLATGGATVIGTMGGAENKTVTYRITGFSCVTCAVGLDTMLGQQPGVVHCKSSYSAATTTIEFKPSLITENFLKSFISEMGFIAK